MACGRVSATAQLAAVHGETVTRTPSEMIGQGRDRELIRPVVVRFGDHPAEPRFGKLMVGTVHPEDVVSSDEHAEVGAPAVDLGDERGAALG